MRSNAFSGKYQAEIGSPLITVIATVGSGDSVQGQQNAEIQKSNISFLLIRNNVDAYQFNILRTLSLARNN